MERDREADRARLLAVQEAARSGQHASAARLAEAALREGIEHPLLYNVLSLEHEHAGRVAEAERLLRRGLAMAPSDLGLRNALGLCLMGLERHDEALAEFDALIAAHDALPFLHANRGAAQFALGRIAAAEASYRRAVELDSTQGLALAGLANLARSRGDFPAARHWAERALAAVPGLPDAQMSLAAADLGERKLGEAEARVRELLARGRLDTLQAAYASGLLGDVLDKQGRIDEAFAAYESCNDALRRFHADRFTGETSALDYVVALRGYFERNISAWNRRLASARSLADRAAQGTGGVSSSPRAAAARHVFLLGFPRSGTTLLEVVLEGHRDIVSIEEKELLIDGVGAYMQRPEDLDRLLHASPSELDALRSAYWQRAREEGADPAGRVFVDKHPLNTLKLPLIALLFPEAKILFACRDPRDVVLSCFRHRFRMSAPIFELLTLPGGARYYDAVMRLAVLLTANLPLDICLVRHEDVVTGFAREMKRLCEYIGIDWDPAMSDFAVRARRRNALTPSTAQLVHGLSTEGVGVWRRYRSHLGESLPRLEPWVRRFYYDED